MKPVHTTKGSNDNHGKADKMFKLEKAFHYLVVTVSIVLILYSLTLAGTMIYSVQRDNAKDAGNKAHKIMRMKYVPEEQRDDLTKPIIGDDPVFIPYVPAGSGKNSGRAEEDALDSRGGGSSGGNGGGGDADSSKILPAITTDIIPYKPDSSIIQQEQEEAKKNAEKENAGNEGEKTGKIEGKEQNNQPDPKPGK